MEHNFKVPIRIHDRYLEIILRLKMDYGLWIIPVKTDPKREKERKRERKREERERERVR